jgi:hypothetical protein
MSRGISKEMSSPCPCGCADKPELHRPTGEQRYIAEIERLRDAGERALERIAGADVAEAARILRSALDGAGVVDLASKRRTG